ncbi:MAG: hypothetical protein Q9181_006460 [Wetmoreana brouardii]
MAVELGIPSCPSPWDPMVCKHYIAEVIGNQERFPERELYDPGFMTILERLQDRYGADHFKSICHVFRNYLENPDEGTNEEQALWHQWRVEQADKAVREPKWPRLVETRKCVILWNDGGQSRVPVTAVSSVHAMSTAHSRLFGHRIELRQQKPI